MPTTYNTRSVTQDTVFERPQARLFTFSVYGRKLEFYRLGYRNNFFLGNMDIKLDDTHGATFLIYPWDARPRERARYARIARKNGWNLLRGELPSAGSGDLVLIRNRTPAPGYYGALYPTGDNGLGAPCYADDPEFGPDFPMKDLPPKFRVTPDSLGPAAPLGIICGRNAAQRQPGIERCVARLSRAFKQEGGAYTVTSPPA